ncbi:MAG: recombinase family protein [Terriglobales bacterium]|jgi:DNA invertase Pin-like site-specific DNA recombinase
MSEKIKPQHLARKAILYVRQSSPYQVVHNLESQKLQYAMEARLHQLGWHEIEVVDDDLGRSAAGVVTRAGFERMVAEVCLGKVGAVAAREVSRFARNSRDWQQLVEVCRVVDTVLIDQEMVYAPRLSNDRLLLGLKGSLNEYELDLLRQRSVEARREKARRGELLQAAPVGYIKTEDQRLEKDPDRRVQQAILLVFRKFMELGTVRQTLMWFLEHGLQVPTRNARGETFWKRPVYRSMHRILTSPIYGGAYTYGKTEQLVCYDGGRPRYLCRRKPREQWLALIPGAHDGYVSWEEFERIAGAIRENTQGAGAVKNGPALLTGLLRCSRCGRKLSVRYTGSGHDVLRYSCVRGWLDNGEPRCIAFGGISVDEAISREVLRVVQPAAIEASVLASQELGRQQDDILDALHRDLEAARYTAERAQRQYDASDPENRLVTAELERRWNLALQHVREIEVRIEQHGAAVAPGPAASLEDFYQLSQQLETIWTDPATSVRLKKRIVRTLIEEVLVDVDSSASELVLTLHWKGDAHTELRLPRRRRGQCSTQTSPELIEAVGVLARICSDDLIAGILNRNGRLTGRGNRWTRERVTALRSHHHIPCYKREEQQQQPWMNLTDAAALLDVSPRTLRLAIDRGDISADHPFTDGPWVISRDVLEGESAQALKRRVAREVRRPTIPDSQQHESLFSTT